jgi:hypothetical protein
MMFMRVLMVESLCQTAMGSIPPLECLLPGARGSQLLRLVLFAIKHPFHLRTPALGSLARHQRLSGVATGVPGACLVRAHG